MVVVAAQDEIQDYNQAQKVESSLADVVALRENELSSKHKYEEEKRLLKHVIGQQGNVGELVTLTVRCDLATLDWQHRYLTN